MVYARIKKPKQGVGKFSVSLTRISVKNFSVSFSEFTTHPVLLLTPEHLGSNQSINQIKSVFVQSITLRHQLMGHHSPRTREMQQIDGIRFHAKVTKSDKTGHQILGPCYLRSSCWQGANGFRTKAVLSDHQSLRRLCQRRQIKWASPKPNNRTLASVNWTTMCCVQGSISRLPLWSGVSAKINVVKSTKGYIRRVQRRI